jgi:type II restriction/modification system DNA methylase subunit YeeA
MSSNLLLFDTHQKILKVLEQTEYLQPRYHVVIANPPYMGNKGMNNQLKEFLKNNYSDYKSDLFGAFIVRNTELAVPKGHLGFMSPFVWMFISSFEKLRLYIIEKKTITSLVQLEYSGFDGATVPICTFTIENQNKPKYQGSYIRLSDFKGAENQAPKTLEIIKNYNSYLMGA